MSHMTSHPRKRALSISDSEEEEEDDAEEEEEIAENEEILLLLLCFIFAYTMYLVQACAIYVHNHSRPNLNYEMRTIRWRFFEEKCSASDRGFHATFRMSKLLFGELLKMIRESPAVALMPHPGEAVRSHGKALGMTILFLARGNGYQALEDQFGVCRDRCWHVVWGCLRAIISVLQTTISFPRGADLLKERNAWSYITGEVLEIGQLYSGFDGAIGAVDGTHVAFRLKSQHGSWDPNAWRNRKGFTSTNVMLVVSSTLRIMYASVGMEGCASDETVLKTSNLLGLLPPNCFLLADAGYALQEKKILTPYRSTRYHLQDWAGSGHQPCNKKELFNLRHSALRARVEIANGRLKMRFRILEGGIDSSLNQLNAIIFACLCLHNYIEDRTSETLDELIARVTKEMKQKHSRRHPTTASASVEEEEEEEKGANCKAKNWRNNIARELYDHFIHSGSDPILAGSLDAVKKMHAAQQLIFGSKKW